MKNKKKIDAFGVKNGGIVYTVPEGKKNAGQTKILLTPEGKRAKFKLELATEQKFCNNGQPKYNEDESAMHLNVGERIYRKAYIAAQNESRAIYAKQHSTKVDKTTVSPKK